MHIRAREGSQLRFNRRDVGTASISKQSGAYGVKDSKLNEVRVSFTFIAVDTAYVVPHNLGRVPNGFEVVNITKSGRVYGSIPLNADMNVISLKCSTANTTADIIVR